MKKIYKDCLFERKILVSDGAEIEEHLFEVLFSMASLFNIRIVSGGELVSSGMINYISEQLGENVPEPFYRGFPQSVKELSPDQLLFDQLFHYFITYGIGYFEEQGRSVLESIPERSVFKEDTAVKEFSVVTEERAMELIHGIIDGLLMSTRPLSDTQYALILEYVRDYGCGFEKCASKNTAIRLLSDTRSLAFVRFISMSDVIKLVDEINYRFYRNDDIKDLNLRNQDRKFITSVMDRLFADGRADISECCEKKAVWCGLLHHLHYKPKNETAETFVNCMRGKENLSVYSGFEKAMSGNDIENAVKILSEGKGSSAVLRNIDYIMSRCGSKKEVSAVLAGLDSSNVIVLIQLLLRYADSSSKIPNGKYRTFQFTRHNKLKKHAETPDEAKRRKSEVPEKYRKLAADRIREMLEETLRGRLGKVYIDPEMKMTALPLQENTSQGGYGVLTRGSRIPLEKGKKIRAFTYWEKVNDIDLSVIGIDKNGSQTEYSWRSMYDKQSDEITYSGDQTSGFKGGSEYFDVDVELFRKRHPGLKYLIFCDNVYSRTPFSGCVCRAGYMLRDSMDSGEVYEPKTVESSFTVSCDSTFAYLFGIDLKKKEFVWLNTARSGNTRVAGTESLSHLIGYMNVTSVMNIRKFFKMAASELTDDPALADIIVSDKTMDLSEGQEQIRSWDTDKVLAIMNM